MQRILGLLICLFLAWPSKLSAQTTTDQEPAISQQSQETIEAQIKRALRLLKAERNIAAYQNAKEALERSQQRGDLKRAARAANLLGTAAFRLGRVREAVEYYKQSFAVTVLDEDTSEVSKLQLAALARAGGLLRTLGRYEDALWCYQKVLQVYHEQNDRGGVALTLTRLGKLYADTGDTSQALRYSLEALQLAKTLNDKKLEEHALESLLIAEEQHGNYEMALQYGQQGLALSEARPLSQQDRTQEATELRFARLQIFTHLATTYSALAQYQKAAEFFEQALRHCRLLQTPTDLILGDYAWTQLQLGNPEQALTTVTEALKNLRHHGGNKHAASRFHATAAEALRALGRNEEALKSYRLAIATLEQARLLSIPTEISRAGIIASRQQVFIAAIEFLLSQKLDAEALEIAERYHARAFLDVLAEAGIESSAELTPEQKEQEDKLLTQISTIQRELWKPDVVPEAEKKLAQELEQTERELELLRLKIRRANPRYASIKYPQPLPLATLAKDTIGTDTALVEFVLGDKQSAAWVVYQGRVSAVLLPPAKEIETLVNDYRAAFSGKVYSLTALQAIARQKALGQQLYQKLFQPLEAHLTAAQKLAIVPDGALSYLPFETLVTSANIAPIYLIERYAISYAPSASALVAIRALNQNAEAKGFIAFGDPIYTTAPNTGEQRGGELRQLPFTRIEVNEIASLFAPADRRIWLGAEANEQRVKTEALQQYRYLHFAAHGDIDEEHPARSGLILSVEPNSKEDGRLQMSEVMRLNLNADLVTLSACRTGIGKLMNGEGMIGLTRAFLYAGANSVVVSLWNVNDVATASLMKAFYRNLQQGVTKDEALRQAKLALLKGQQRAWRHPYFWASFVLIGEAH